ncbi:MAG TPA: pantetheine-phosphate adenylyltransferase [Flavobacteriaceae bacterium]|nr:pantetheine-phosphate adenylyltransferase [Flavobacteriaceae bacterium]
MKTAIFPGSFDPITLGHQDIIEKSLNLFDNVIIGIGQNIEKKYMFSAEKRKKFVENTFQSIDNIQVKVYDGLTVDFCKKNNANYIIRGLRNVSDFEFEKTIALTNRRLSGIETVFFLTSAKNSFISSGIVRDLISNNGDYSLLIPKGLNLK